MQDLKLINIKNTNRHISNKYFYNNENKTKSMLQIICCQLTLKQLKHDKRCSTTELKNKVHAVYTNHVCGPELNSFKQL